MDEAPFKEKLTQPGVLRHWLAQLAEVVVPPFPPLFVLVDHEVVKPHSVVVAWKKPEDQNWNPACALLHGCGETESKRCVWSQQELGVLLLYEKETQLDCCRQAEAQPGWSATVGLDTALFPMLDATQSVPTGVAAK